MIDPLVAIVQKLLLEIKVFERVNYLFCSELDKQPTKQYTTNKAFNSTWMTIRQKQKKLFFRKEGGRQGD